MKCEICNKIVLGLKIHKWRVHGPGQHWTPIAKGDNSSSWNKGLTAITDNRVLANAKAVSVTLQRQIKNGTYVPSPGPGEDARKRLSAAQSLKNRGGKCKWFDVDGVKVQGTWERDLAKTFNLYNIKWIKPHCRKDILLYLMDGKERAYTPDFYLPEFDLLLELKGYWWGRDKEKMECVFNQHPTKKILIIEKIEYKKMLSGNFELLGVRLTSKSSD